MKDIGRIKYYRDLGMPGVEVCRVVQSDHAFPIHAHEEIYAVCLMEDGRRWCKDKGNEREMISTGQICLINPGQPHSGIPVDDRKSTYRMIYVGKAWMHQAAGELTEGANPFPEFTAFVIKDRSLSRQMLLASRLFMDNGDRMEKESAILEAFDGLLCGYGGIRRSGRPSDHDHRIIQDAKEFLAENLSEKVSLASVANAVGLSRYHFLRVFKKQTGVPPHVFRTQRRIDRAQILMKKRMPFAEVALETGFTDQSHFTHKFKQFTGATPGQYLAK